MPSTANKQSVPNLLRVVVTNCTNRKVAGSPIRLETVPRTRRPLSMANSWRALVRRTAPSCTARDLYRGRSIVDAEAAAKAVGARLHIVSAGLGLVTATDRVPNYDLTVTPGSILGDLLAEQGLEPQDSNPRIGGKPSQLSGRNLYVSFCHPPTRMSHCQLPMCVWSTKSSRNCRPERLHVCESSLRRQAARRCLSTFCRASCHMTTAWKR
jgi:hypothetical protein